VLEGGVKEYDVPVAKAVPPEDAVYHSIVPPKIGVAPKVTGEDEHILAFVTVGPEELSIVAVTGTRALEHDVVTGVVVPVCVPETQQTVSEVPPNSAVPS
jgi:hypothetical protein